MARRLVNRHLKKRFLKRRFRHCAYIHWVDLQEERSNVYQRYYHVHTLVRVSTTECLVSALSPSSIPRHLPGS